MPQYKLVGVIERNVVETFYVEITANSAEEAQDVCYEILSEYPDSDLVADRLLLTNREGTRPSSILVDLTGSEMEEVFDSNDDEPA